MPSKNRNIVRGHFTNDGVTVNDFANAGKTSARLPKGRIPPVSKHQDLSEDKSFELDSDSETSNKTDEFGKKCVIKGVQDPHKSTASSMQYNRYSLDFWFVLSDYIDPDCVGHFASICQSSYYVTTTTAFYKRLWRRWKPLNRSLQHIADERLVCKNMEKVLSRGKKENTRAYVIRALYYCYPPFVKHTKLKELQQDLNVLLRARCLMQWHKATKDAPRKRYIFCFKFQLDSFSEKAILTHLLGNSEEGCCVLHVVCNHFIDTSRSQVSGLLLTNSSVTINSDMTSQKMKLTFHKAQRKLKRSGILKYEDMTGVQLTLSSVVSYQVNHWWERSYPFKNVINYAL